MRRRILKYKLPVTRTNSINMPKGSEILSIQLQDNEVCIWVSCFTSELESEITERTFYIVVTEQEYESDNIGKYLDTVQCGKLVWHIFEKV